MSGHGGIEGKGDNKPPRKSLIERASEVTVRDPAAHARKAVSELDKTAKNSMAKRKGCKDQLAADEKELHHLDDQIARIKVRYDPLCAQLSEQKELKAHLLKKLAECEAEERRIIGDTKKVVVERMQDDSKFQRKMASHQLEMQRGYSLNPSSTFHQTTKRELN